MNASNKYNLQIGIVIIGFKNVDGIKRLLTSIDCVKFGDDQVRLIFSIDYSGSSDVQDVAEAYEWKHGEKVIKAYQKNLGLRTHILKCGDYLDEYDLDAIIVLEDDIFISPNAYQYALEAVEYYKDKNNIAGISLYKHEFNLNAKHPFLDYYDGHDVYFMQYAQSWGQVWMRESWKQFITWFNNDEWKNISPNDIPRNVKGWQNSWLKYHIMYCISENKYFVYPRISLSTNYSDVGVHGDRENTDMQVRLNFADKPTWDFVALEDSMAVYDAFYQNVRIKRFVCENDTDTDIDLYGIREINPSIRYHVSFRDYNYTVVKRWGLSLRPIEANVFHNIPGDAIKVYDLHTKNVNKMTKTNNELFEYELKGLNLLSVECITFIFGKFFYVLKRKYKKIKREIKVKMNNNRG